ncbi:MAG: chromatin modification-related protein EAF7-domain-containing protein [Benjaminiella poitrasii]|nr:MAG: chromatin modification-related protein EAF7-domain-containing protein [Benjaminiella poitrasii]
MSELDTAEDVEMQNTIDNISIKQENDQVNLEYKEWDAGMELALLNAISRCKPVGIHKHFRIISIQKQFNQHSPITCSIEEIWQKLSGFYGMEALDELEEEDEEQEAEEREEQDKRKGNIHEFSLPLEDYEQLISEHRQDDQSISSVREESSSPIIPPAKRTRTNKRDSSPANSVTDSMTSTPEPDENKTSRRTPRGTRKSEATPEPNMRSSGRRAGRSASTTSTTTRGSKRQVNKRK